MCVNNPVEGVSKYQQSETVLISELFCDLLGLEDGVKVKFASFSAGIFGIFWFNIFRGLIEIIFVKKDLNFFEYSEKFFEYFLACDDIGPSDKFYRYETF